METEEFLFYAVAYDPIEICTCLAPQYEHQYQNFVKDTYVGFKKITRKGHKIAQP